VKASKNDENCTLKTWKKFDSNTLVAPAYTPFTETGDAVNYSKIPSQAAYLYSQGYNTVFICGTNGESYSCTLNERKLMLEEWVKTNEISSGKMRLINNISCQSLNESIELAKHADSLNVDLSIAYMPSCFFKPEGDIAVASLLSTIAKTVPKLGVFFYYLPGMSGVICNTANVLKIANKNTPNVIGCKFTDSDLGQLHQAVNEGFDVMIGNGDELLLSALVLGASGGFSVPGMMNGLKPLINVSKCFNNNDIKNAMKWQYQAGEQFRFLKSTRLGFMSTGKALSNELTSLSMGPPRLPLEELSDVSELKNITESFEKIMNMTK
jgi:N-acetylneuraminate lyase